MAKRKWWPTPTVAEYLYGNRTRCAGVRLAHELGHIRGRRIRGRMWFDPASVRACAKQRRESDRRGCVPRYTVREAVAEFDVDEARLIAMIDCPTEIGRARATVDSWCRCGLVETETHGGVRFVVRAQVEFMHRMDSRARREVVTAAGEANGRTQ